ncbi:MAG: AAA family ATPase [Spirochaetales bacterium]|nr:AAA family ATPase [Spirochaetales bacterium]
MKKLPLGIQTFEKIREDDYVYADKTDLIYDLVHNGSVYFLSRPRRFGKSLLISTLDAYFNGRKELFEGLKIADLEKEWKKYPVIRIDFGLSGYEKNEKLQAVINDVLIGYERKYNVTPAATTSYDVRFKNVIVAAKEAANEKAVVLIDEYDKPILDALYTDVENINRTMIRDFYSVLKSCDEYLNFVFLTGITRVPHLNIFSGLNHINDISMSDQYSTICGITKEELLTDFSDRIDDMAAARKITRQKCLEKLKLTYDGYHFSKSMTDVYNPFSLINAFAENSFVYKWFGSGTPSSLMKILEHQNADISGFVEDVVAYESDFDDFDPTDDNFLPIIYQSGYLTLKSYDENSELYTLDIPNGEVRTGFYRHLIRRFSSVKEQKLGVTVEAFRSALENADMAELETLIRSAVASLPYMQDKNYNEDMYRNILFMMFSLTSYRTIAESVSLLGRADIVVELEDKVYIFELKYCRDGKADELAAAALQQIEDKKYAVPYIASGRKIIKTALVFDQTGLVKMCWNANNLAILYL